MNLRGRTWVFGDDVSVEYFIPGRYDHMMYFGPFEELATHLFEDLDPSQRPSIEPGDVIVAGRGFGQGKHHDGLILAMRQCRLAGYIADSFHPLFQRTSIDMGIPALALPAVRGRIETGDVIDWSLAEGRFTNVSKGEQIMVPPVSGLLLDILTAGGWSNYVRDAVTA